MAIGRGFSLAGGAVAAWAALCGPVRADEPVYDPFEPFNRSMFALHEGIDKTALEPLARASAAVAPSPVWEGLGNVLDNLKAPVILANDVLQLEPKRAASTTMRFVVNTTLGLGGVFDVASTMGLEKHDEDFGQTLAKWGVPPGPYLFVPVLGPTTLRDGVGRGVDAALDPISQAQFPHDSEARALRSALTGLQVRTNILGVVEDVRATSDPYLTIRTTSQLWRETEVRNGKAELPDLPDLEALPPEESTPVPPMPEPDTSATVSQPSATEPPR